MKPIDYCAPSTVPEALGLLRTLGNKARPLAGGTDLMIFLQHGRVDAETLVDLGRIPGLAGIDGLPDGGLHIGALTRLRDIERSPVVRHQYAALAESMRELAGIQIRNMATLGGNTCNASPAADTIPALMALDAVAVIASESGERRVPYTRFFVGPGRTVLAPGELLTAIELPATAPGTGSRYIKLAVRNAMDIAIVGVGVSVTLDGEHVVACRIALGAVGPTVIRADAAEAALQGKLPDEATIQAAADAARDMARPISDQRASAAYRKKMVGVVTRDALRSAVAAARQSRS